MMTNILQYFCRKELLNAQYLIVSGTTQEKPIVVMSLSI